VLIGVLKKIKKNIFGILQQHIQLGFQVGPVLLLQKINAETRDCDDALQRQLLRHNNIHDHKDGDGFLNHIARVTDY
jgi:hypothetical protein